MYGFKRLHMTIVNKWWKKINFRIFIFARIVSACCTDTPVGGDKWSSWIDHYFNRFIKINSFRNENCWLIPSTHPFKKADSAQKSSHWTVHSNDSFKPTESSRNKTPLLRFCSAVLWVCLELFSLTDRKNSMLCV